VFHLVQRSLPFGKDAVDCGTGKSLSAPQSFMVRFEQNEVQKPYFYFTYVIFRKMYWKPIRKVASYQLQWRLENWQLPHGLPKCNQPLFQQGGSILAYCTEIDPEERGTWEEVNIDT
jgi:hypothetical protein